MMGKPAWMQLSMIQGAIVTIAPPITETTLVPITRIWVGKSSLKQTQKNVYQTEMAKRKMKMKTSTPMLLPTSGFQSDWFHMKVKITEHRKVAAKHAQAASLRLVFMIMKQQMGYESISETPMTSPLMKMSSLNLSSINAGAQNSKMMVHWSKISINVIPLKDLNLNRSNTENLFWPLLSLPALLNMFCTSYISSTSILKSVRLLSLAMYLKSLSALRGELRITRHIGVSRTTITTARVAIAMGMKQKTAKMSCQSPTAKYHSTFSNTPNPQKSWMATDTFSLYSSEMVSAMKQKQILNAFCMPTVARNSPTPAMVILTQKIVMVMPMTEAHMQMLSNFFRPTKSPTSVNSTNPTTVPTYISVMMESKVSFSLLHRQSPNQLASVYIDLRGMQAARSEGSRLQTQSKQLYPMIVSLHSQGS